MTLVPGHLASDACYWALGVSARVLGVGIPKNKNSCKRAIESINANILVAHQLLFY